MMETGPGKGRASPDLLTPPVPLLLCLLYGPQSLGQQSQQEGDDQHSGRYEVHFTFIEDLADADGRAVDWFHRAHRDERDDGGGDNKAHQEPSVSPV